LTHSLRRRECPLFAQADDRNRLIVLKSKVSVSITIVETYSRLTATVGSGGRCIAPSGIL
jgi:hypothetical protein